MQYLLLWDRIIFFLQILENTELSHSSSTLVLHVPFCSLFQNSSLMIFLTAGGGEVKVCCIYVVYAECVGMQLRFSVKEVSLSYLSLRYPQDFHKRIYYPVSGTHSFFIFQIPFLQATPDTKQKLSYTCGDVRQVSMV